MDKSGGEFAAGVAIRHLFGAAEDGGREEKIPTMDLSLTILLAAFAGGIFGAAIGGLFAFVWTGVAVLVGVAAGLGGSEFDLLAGVAFGPVFGPHVAFAGGAAAAAFAARRGDIEDGKDIITPLVGIGDPPALLVGGLFGLGGHIVQQLLVVLFAISETTFFYPTLTDTIALTVGISAIVARLAFGKTGLFGNLAPEARERGRLVPGGGQVWVAFQQGFFQASVLGLGTGLLAAWLVTALAAANPDYGPIAVVLGFGISATSLILLQFGYACPITHHMTLPAGVAAFAVLGVGGGATVALLAGAVAGILGAIIGEFFSRLFLIHGDTHIDPPANAIWVMATVVVVAGLLLT